MNKPDDQLWAGLSDSARAALETRNYTRGSLAAEVSEKGIEAGRLLGLDRKTAEVNELWIPGVEFFARTIYPQRHRGFFGEFARREEGLLAKIGFWPAQWASARMFAQTAKGFHIHPPSIPAGKKAEDWFQQLFVKEPENYQARLYAQEQWDVMFFVQGTAEMILQEARAGLPRRTMRFLIEGDNHRGSNNVGVVIPPGVAHALRAEGSEDLIMVYGTSVTFRPEFEGRIAAEVESAPLPEGWSCFVG